MRKLVFIIFSLMCLVPRSDAVAQTSEPVSDELHAQINGYTADIEKQAFEKKLLELLFVAKDNIHRGMGTRKIDLESYRPYFSEKGWNEYLAYISYMHELIDQSILDIEGIDHLNVKSQFCYKTQSYEEDSLSLTAFSARGQMASSPFDYYDAYKSFSFKIQYEVENIKNLTGFKIHSWEVNIKPWERCPDGR